MVLVVTKQDAIAKTLAQAKLLKRSRFALRLPGSHRWTAGIALWELDDLFKHVPAEDIVECRGDGAVIYPVEGS